VERGQCRRGQHADEHDEGNRAIAARDEVGDLGMVLDAGGVAVTGRVVGGVALVGHGAECDVRARSGEHVFIQHTATPAVAAWET
jgi:hypothetical protein